MTTEKVFFALFLTFVFSFVLVAEDAKGFSGAVWLDAAAGPKGLVLCPQYAWSANTPAGKLAGFGFAESIPDSRLYSNNSARLYPGKQSILSARAEYGFLPAHHGDFHFWRVGPQADLTGIAPKSPVRFNVAWLPKVASMTTTQIFFYGDTDRFPILVVPGGTKVKANLEFFRYNGMKSRDYGETYLFFHYAKREHVVPYLHWISSGARNIVSVGIRLQ